MLIENYPTQGLEKLEEVSFLIRKGMDLSRFLKVDHSRDIRDQAKDLVEYTNQTMPLFVKPK